MSREIIGPRRSQYQNSITSHSQSRAARARKVSARLGQKNVELPFSLNLNWMTRNCHTPGRRLPGF